MANLIKYGNLALDNLLTLGQISNKKHRERQIDRQIGLSSMVALFIYQTLGGLRRNNKYNNVTHFSTFPIIFKIIATLFYFLIEKPKKKSQKLHVINGTVKSMCRLLQCSTWFHENWRSYFSTVMLLNLIYTGWEIMLTGTSLLSWENRQLSPSLHSPRI